MKKMKIGTIVLIVVLAVVALIAIWAVSGYNSLVQDEENVNNAYADIQTQLQRRADLIPNFVNTVKGYSDYEQATYTAVTEARAKVMGATDAKSTQTANDELDKAISVWVNAVTEAYPELKANQNYLALQDELAGTENRIANSRRTYNNAGTEYNSAIRKFPKNILASLFGFEKKDLFTASSEAQNVPSVNF